MSDTAKSNCFALSALCLIMLIVVTGLTTSCFKQAQAPQTELRMAVIISSTGWAELRGAPNGTSLLMMQIANEVPVEMIGENGEWAKVKANGRTGYVRKGLLRYP